MWNEVDESHHKLIIITIIFSPALTSIPITIYPLTSFLWKDENGKRSSISFMAGGTYRQDHEAQAT